MTYNYIIGYIVFIILYTSYNIIHLIQYYTPHTILYTSYKIEISIIRYSYYSYIVHIHHIVSSTHTMNYPFYLYPGAPFSGYHDPMFLSELKRLSDYLEKIDCIDEPLLLHLTIGAPMEELKHGELKYPFQYRQIYPDHLKETALLGVRVINLMIIPNPNNNPFDPINLNEFHLTKYNPDDMIKRTPTTYVSETLPIEMEHFYTMMPTNDIKRNKKGFEQFKKKGFDEHFPDIDKFQQNDNDLIFIENFYRKLDQTVQRILDHGGKVTCFSFAVFSEGGIFAHINNYRMFREIKKIFNKDGTLLAEWIFKDSVYHVVPFQTTSDELCYISPDEIPDINRYINRSQSAIMNRVMIEPLFEDNQLILNYIPVVDIICGQPV